MRNSNTHVLEWVDDYLHNVLEAEQAEYVEQHCAECPICEVALREARKRLEALESVPPSEVSEDLIRKTMKRVETYERTVGRRRRWTFRGILAVAAAYVLVVGGLTVYYATLSPSPYDLKIYGPKSLMADTEGSFRVQVYRRDASAAVAGVPVSIEMLRGDGSPAIRLASFKTDGQGTGSPRFRLPDWKDGEYEIRFVADTPGRDEILSRRLSLKRSWKLMLSSDKPVYQPGQVIHLRGLALRRPDLRPITGQEMVFSITDPKGNMIFKQPGVTSKYGIGSADCPLATEIIEGPYAISCRVGDTESKKTVEVKKYVLPKFKITVDLDKPYYEPGQRVKAEIDAAYFFGKPVASGQVRIELETTDVQPRIAGAFEAVTDKDGHAEVQFSLPPSFVGSSRDSGDARFQLLTTVTDTAGQKQTATTSRVVTNKPLRVEVVPEAGRLVRDVPNVVYLMARYADGRPAQARIAVAGSSEELQTSALGLAIIEITPKTEKHPLSLQATDRNGITCSRQVTLECGPPTGDFLLRTDKAVYTGGETMQVTVIGGGVDPVFLDFLKDGQVMLTQSVSIAGGRGQMQFDIPPDVFGTLELQAYRFDRIGVAGRRSRAVYIAQAKAVSIQAELDRKEYQPGRSAKLNLRLTDDRGQAVCGAVSLAAVDEAVFSVLDQAPGMEDTFFNLEQQLLQPIYAIYPWAPDWMAKDKSTERVEFEKALFSRTAKETTDHRQGQLRALIDEGYISPRQLEILEDADVAEVLERGHYSDELRSLLGGSGDDRIVGSSYSPKISRTRADRASGIALAKSLWISFGVVAGLAAFIWLLTFMRGWAMLLMGFVCLCLLVSILMPSLSRARELSRNTMRAASLSSIDKALYVLNEESSIAAASESFRADLQTTPSPTPPRIREWFPETLLWRPELITDDQGRASLEISLADSITTWRLSASAVSGEGRLGSLQSPIRVFQPFFVDLNLPVSLTRGDEITIPAVVYNYLDKPQTVSLRLEAGDWFEMLDGADRSIDLQPGQVLSTGFRIRAAKVGQHRLQITGQGEGVADAVRREIEVVPDGRRVEQVLNGTLTSPASMTLDLPKAIIEDSAKAILKIYPTSFSQLVEGLDSIFQQPYGCFEQTSSTTYPNVLALDYLRRTNKNVPEVEAKAKQYIHLGYQRLLTFEVSGGGFEWFGHSPANRVLTAYGLMEFQDMARVHDVDPNLIERTRDWLLQQRRSDGSWEPEGHAMHEAPTRGRGDQSNLSTTAYIAWAVSSDPNARSMLGSTRDYIVSFEPQQVRDPYVLALVANALLSIDSNDVAARPYLAELARTMQRSQDGKHISWGRDPQARTTFYGSGRSGEIETTSLAALAMLKAGYDPAATKAALTWVAEQMDSRGTFHSTQATVLALKALIAGTGAALGSDQARRIEVTVADGGKLDIEIPADQGEVVKQVDLTSQIKTGSTSVRLTERVGSGSVYQLTFRYYVPGAKPAAPAEPLTISLNYDRTELAVGDQVTATATVANNMAGRAPMIILDLPIPPGFAPDSGDWQSLLGKNQIAKYEITARSIIVYLRGIDPGKPLSLTYRLHATTPVKVTAQAAKVYEYYNPGRSGSTPPVSLVVRGRI